MIKCDSVVGDRGGNEEYHGELKGVIGWGKEGWGKEWW